MANRIEMTRQQLSDLVWSMPIGKAASSFPMSHESLKKLCQRHEVLCRHTGTGRRVP
jgi:hypothetical protein